MSSDVESCEEQDGGNHISIGSTTAKLWPTLWLYVSKKEEERFLLFV